ncbi:MAG: hypothetical protein KDA92_19005 [Planctomycetales bacterium]|nr:hypothetical protein [Planctomycetales bacterium]
MIKRMLKSVTRCAAASRLIVSAAVVLIASATHVVAELRVTETRSPNQVVTVVQMTVTPAAEPVPALRERLVVRDIEMLPGNAATHYLRLYPESVLDTRLSALVEKFGDELYEWYSPGSEPLHTLPLDKLREAARSFDREINNFVAPATLRRDCDWGLGIQEMQGPQIVQILLPEFNASRDLSRMLMLRARVAIAEGDYQRAIDELRMNNRLAENVASEPLLICTLIGIAERSMGQMVTLELMAADNSPNLYWALAELPEPTEAVKRAMQFEMSIGQRMFPFLKDADTAQHAPGEWARLLTQSVSDWSKVDANTPRMPPELMQASLSVMMIAAYPSAKQRLIEGGLAADVVERMPVGQVLAVDSSRAYQQIADSLEKQLYEPYHVARRRSEADLFGSVDGVPFVTTSLGQIMAMQLLPGVKAARSAGVSAVRHTRALQVIEAMRMYAAEHGKLPAYLDDIKAVSIPVNPVTNQPFMYHVESDQAILELPASDGVSRVTRFEITLKKS